MTRSINHPKFFEFCDQSVEKFGKWGFLISAVIQPREIVLSAANYVRCTTTYCEDVAVDTGEPYYEYKTIERTQPFSWWKDKAQEFFSYAWPVMLKDSPNCASFLHLIKFNEDFVIRYMAVHAIKTFHKRDGHYVDTTPIDD